MNKLVPMISSGVAGPLGVMHLPRLWLKSSLEARGLLADGYPGCGTGYDQMVLDGLGLNREKVIHYIKEHRPTYPQLETWIKAQPGVKLDPAGVGALNKAIAGYIHKDDVRHDILGANGIADNGSIRDAVNLNNLDDWLCFHQAVLK